MPAISQRLLSRQRLLDARTHLEAQRKRQGSRHQVHYFHQVDDPYSALTASCLPALAARYDVDFVPHVVGPPPDSAAPERDKLVAYSRKDAQLLARHWHLNFQDHHAQPSSVAVAQATRLLVAAAHTGRFTEFVSTASLHLWRNVSGIDDLTVPDASLPSMDDAAVAAHTRESDALRKRLGHYLGATFFYGGEWYWGLDRLHHLEQRLQEVGAQRPQVSGLLYPPDADLQSPVHLEAPPPVDFFFSLRSPYSAIVAPRIFKLGQLTGAKIRLRYVLPMVMRGLQVPREKRRYISTDAAREAHVRGIPFGRLNDPVGRPTERGLALIPLAELQGKGQDYILAFMQGVWAEGIDAGSDRGLRKIAERAGLDWGDTRNALQDETWRAVAEANRAEMAKLGLWGVPSFRVGDLSVWGQDRLWAITETLLKGAE